MLSEVHLLNKEYIEAINLLVNRGADVNAHAKWQYQSEDDEFDTAPLIIVEKKK